MEADLQRYGVDFADYWRGTLSLRRVSVLLHYSPEDSACKRLDVDLPPGWDVHALLLADLFHAFTGEPHPSRPTGGKGKSSRYAEQRAALEAQRARLKAANP